MFNFDLESVKLKKLQSKIGGRLLGRLTESETLYAIDVQQITI